MFVWSKKLVLGLLAAFIIMIGVFLLEGPGAAASHLKSHTTFWITLNYAGLIIWIFVWMIDQANMRSKNVWVWLVPFLFAPLPTLLAFILYLQKKMA